VSAIANHDESDGIVAAPIAAALIIADKSDVRRSRVRTKDPMMFDIHDRVNYAVTGTELICDPAQNREHVFSDFLREKDSERTLAYGMRMAVWYNEIHS